MPGKYPSWSGRVGLLKHHERRVAPTPVGYYLTSLHEKGFQGEISRDLRVGNAHG